MSQPRINNIASLLEFCLVLTLLNQHKRLSASQLSAVS